MTTIKDIVTSLISAEQGCITSEAEDVYRLALEGAASKGYCVAIDFDGTLCENSYPAIGSERRRTIEMVMILMIYGIKTILWTCREGKELEAAVQWCEKRDLVFNAVNENLPEKIERWGHDCRKVGADEYWDDKAVRI